MSGRVEPALSADEWATVQRTGWYPGHSVAGDLLAVPSDALDIAHAGMALANERLPDGDSRKLTRRMVALCRAAAEACRRDDHHVAGALDLGEWTEGRDTRLAAEYEHMAAALAALLLPPEGT